MSSATLPVSTLGWSSPHLHKRISKSKSPEVRAFRAPRWRAAAMILFMPALSAATAFAAFSSPKTELAQRTLEAERIQNLSYVWLSNQPPERFWQPTMELMLPVTTRSVAPPSVPPDV